MDGVLLAGTSWQHPGNVHHCAPDRLESRTRLSVGHTFHSSAWTNFLAYRGIQSSSGRAGESLSNPGSILDRTRTTDEPNRATRPATVETTRPESSKSAAWERQRVKVLARSGT